MILLSAKEINEIGKWIASWNALGQDSESIANEIARQYSISKDTAADAVKFWKGFNGIGSDEDVPSVFGNFLDGVK